MNGISAKLNHIAITTVKGQEQSMALMEKLLATAQPSAVYSAPVTSGDYTIITASEVSAGIGFGYGLGGGVGPKPSEGETTSEAEAQETQEQPSGFGGGGGGGGAAMARPVAVISVGPEGVQIQPIVDASKIALAFFTTLGGMVIMLSRMRRASRG